MTKWSLERKIRFSKVIRTKTKDNLINCEFCDRKYYKDSEDYYAHLLFDHQKLLSPCKTPKQKKLEANCIIGWSMREEVRAVKRQHRKNQYRSRMIWQGNLIKFFSLIEQSENQRMGLINN